MKNVELLAPAGSPEALDAAIGNGADAIYLGLKDFNARLRSANFTYSQVEAALRMLHRFGRKLYITVNTVFEQREADRIYQLLKFLSSIGPDGLIVQDFGVAAFIKECFPNLKLHASTQMNIASSRAVNVLSKQGFSRVVLARELSLEELQSIRQNTNMELEIFVHGALCMSASGICLFSSYLGGKSANRGLCTQCCRRIYQQGGEQGYYFSPSDLQLLDLLPDLMEAGINSFKIEGRMKSAEYVGTVVCAYRNVLDAVNSSNGEPAIEHALSESKSILMGDFARSKTLFYFDTVLDWLKPEQNGGVGIPLGTLIKVEGSGEERRALIRSSSLKLNHGDSIRLHRADDSRRQALKLKFSTPSASGLWVSIPEGFDVGDSVYLIQTHSKRQHHTQVIPRDLAGFKRKPGRDLAPLIQWPQEKQARSNKRTAASFPEGLYTAVSQIADLYIIQAAHPIRAILAYTERTAKQLLGSKEPLPFKPEQIILNLDPYMPESLDGALHEQIPQLLERGYRQFVLNNPGHFSYFRKSEQDETQLIAGPYLYVFNQWANAFVEDLGAAYFVSPLENNRQNLERTVERGRRNKVFITLYSRPALFRVRADLSTRYDFGAFTDSRGEAFTLQSGAEGSFVYPDTPFSIMDKIPFLKEAGFGRFILDFSGPPLKKAALRDVMEAFNNGGILSSYSRFNWKDGFYHAEEGKEGALKHEKALRTYHEG
ncbi:peptidase U32 family protein [Breznakiellaceae bacterium SP9]